MAEERKRILCIEDDRETAQLLVEDLSERGFDVTAAHDGDAGIAAVLRDHPDLVLCDVNLPALSGFDVLDRLASLAPRFRDMPFLFLTALTDRDNELKGRTRGADDYIHKPVDFDLLAAIIARRLARAPRQEVWPRAIVLSEREIEVLTWSARGKTSDEISSILDLSKRTVDFHIDNARAKLGVATRIQAVVKALTGRMIEP